MDESIKDYREVKVEIIAQKKVIKKFRFSNDDTVWVAKQTVLLEFASLNLTDPLNYGFYMPPLKNKAGKFLDEERPLRDYPAESYGDHLDFRYKRRIFRGTHVDEKKVLKYQSKTYQKKFFDYVVTGNLERAKKLLDKGLDPNFQIDNTGETPLTAMSMMPHSSDACMMLVGCGAHLDYRSADGMTAMHKAVVNNRDDNIAFLLDLGASPNYKDSKGLTPLWHGLLTGASDHCCELLLNERAIIGVADNQGCKEIHVACRQGLDRHLEHLIFYGANLNCRNSSGNTPLHICAIGNQENSARILLFRGADRTVVNHGNQTAHEVAILSGNNDLAALINDFDSSQVTPFLEQPVYSRRRREPRLQSRTSSPSPSLSVIEPVPEHGEILRSVTVSNRVELNGHRENREAMFAKHSKKTNNNNVIVAGNEHDTKQLDSDDSGSECSESDDEAVNKHKKIDRRAFSTGASGKKAPAPIKSGPGTKAHMKSRLYTSIPGRQFIAIADYHPRAPGELALEKGDAVDVLYIGEQGFWEGRVKDRTGWFPSSCIQELKKVNRKEKNRTWFGKKSSHKEMVDKFSKDSEPVARQVHLKKGERGFGFQLRGANSHTARIEFTPSAQFPALQYIGEVDKGGVAEKIGLKSGDFVIEVNGEDVVNATHGYVVSLVANTGKALTLKVVTVSPETVISPDFADGSLSSQANVASGQIDSSHNAKAVGSMDVKKAPPAPYPRSHYSSFTVGNLNSSNKLNDVQMSPALDTVITLDKKVQRKRSVKSMWSDTAWVLHPESIRTEEISKGVVRKTKVTSLENEGDVGLPPRSHSVSSRSSSSSPNISNVAPFAALPRKPSRTSSLNSDESTPSDQHNRPPAPPNYTVTLENMRRIGRKPSFQRSDSEKLMAKVEVTADTKPRTVSTCSDVFPPAPFPEAPSYLPPSPPAEEQPPGSRSMSVPNIGENPSSRNITRALSEPAKQDSASSDEDEPSSDFAKALRKHAAARKQRTKSSKISIDESIALRKREQCLQVINENEESTKTFSNRHMPKSHSSDAILQQKEKGSDSHNLYAASSTSSLDTQTSKDSGIDVSDVMGHAPGEQPPDLASALANAVARRAEKIAKKDSLAKTVEQTNIPMKESAPEHELISVKLKSTHMHANSSVTNSGIANPGIMNPGISSTGIKGQATLSSTPPPTRPKPKSKIEQSVNPAVEDTAFVSKNETGVNEEPAIRNEIVTPPFMFASVSSVNEATLERGSVTDDLPSPPVEFVDDVINENQKTQPIVHSMTSSDPPPPYSPPRVKSDLPLSFSSKPFPEWNAEEVGQWLEYLNMGQYKESFVENDIQGSHLVELSKEDLSELGVKKLGHRLTIDDAIGKLRSQLQYSEV